MTTLADGTAAAIADSVTGSAERDEEPKTLSAVMENNTSETVGASKPESEHAKKANGSANEANGTKDEKADAGPVTAEREKEDTESSVQPQTNADTDAGRKGEKDETEASAELEVNKNTGASDEHEGGNADRKNEDEDKAEGAQADSKDSSTAKHSGRPYVKRQFVSKSKFDPSVLETSSDPVEIRKQVSATDQKAQEKSLL
jgi:hypothetical protein